MNDIILTADSKVDPEVRAEFEERQKSSVSSGAAPNPLQNFDAAAWLAGKSTSGSSTPKNNEPVDKRVAR